MLAELHDTQKDYGHRPNVHIATGLLPCWGGEVSSLDLVGSEAKQLRCLSRESDIPRGTGKGTQSFFPVVGTLVSCEGKILSRETWYLTQANEPPWREVSSM